MLTTTLLLHNKFGYVNKFSKFHSTFPKLALKLNREFQKLALSFYEIEKYFIIKLDMTCLL